MKDQHLIHGSLTNDFIIDNTKDDLEVSSSSNFSLLDLPAELLLKIFQHVNLNDLTVLLLTSKKIIPLIERYFLSEKCKIYLENRFKGKPYSPQSMLFELIRNDIKLLQSSVQSIHPDYEDYQILKSLSSQARIQKALSSNLLDCAKVLLGYPELYQDCLPFELDIECRVSIHTRTTLIKALCLEPSFGDLLLPPLWMLLSPITIILLPLWILLLPLVITLPIIISPKKIINYMKCFFFDSPLMFFDNRVSLRNTQDLQISHLLAQLEGRQWQLVQKFAVK